MLAMEFIQHDGRGGAESESHAAALLAALHLIHPAPHEGRFGLDFDTLIGGLHQPNPWTESWTAFFAEHRLMEMAGQAYEAGRLDREDRRRIEMLCGRFDALIDEPDRASLIHGDVWGGNVLVEGGRVAAFIDPAISFSHPEIELAFIRLFGRG